MTRLRTAIAALFVVLLATACEDATTIDATLIECYTEVVVARESTLDTARAQADVQAVLRKHGYTKERLERELSEVGQDPARFRALYDSVAKRLAARRDTTAAN